MNTHAAKENIVRRDHAWCLIDADGDEPQTFDDDRYASPHQALRAAIAAFNARADVRLIIPGVHLSDRRSRTGIVGLSWLHDRKPNGHWRNLLRAVWSVRGKQHTFSRSPSARGLDIAWWECVCARAKGLGVYIDADEATRHLEAFRLFYQRHVSLPQSQPCRAMAARAI